MEAVIAGRPLTDERKRATAGALLQAYLAGRNLPEHVGDLPDRMLVDRLARMDAKEILATLQEIGGVEWWDKEAFERVFVDLALGGWRPGSVTRREPGRLRVVSTTCPIAAEVARDPRLCALCQGIQRHAAYLALIGQVSEVSLPQLMSRGESACELDVSYRN